MNSFFEKMFKKATPIEDCPDPNFKMKGLECQDLFSGMVASLKSKEFLDCPLINDLGKILWDMVSNSYCPVAISDAMKSLHFLGVGKSEDYTDTKALILMPPTWFDMAKKEPLMQLGAIVYIASHAKDYWNKKLGEESIPRGQSLEVELIKRMIKKYGEIPLTGYQNYILRQFPEGVISVLDLHYNSRPFDKIGPPFPTSKEEIMAIAGCK